MGCRRLRYVRYDKPKKGNGVCRSDLSTNLESLTEVLLHISLIVQELFEASPKILQKNVTCKSQVTASFLSGLLTHTTVLPP